MQVLWNIVDSKQGTELWFILRKFPVYQVVYEMQLEWSVKSSIV